MLNTVNCVEIEKLTYNQLNKKINHYTNANKSNNNYKSNYTNKSNNNYTNNNYKSNKGTFGARTNSTDTGYTPFHKYRRNPRG